VPEYTKYLTLVDAKRRSQCIAMEREQKEAKERVQKAQKEKEAQAKREEEEKREKEAAAARQRAFDARVRSIRRKRELMKIGGIAGAAVVVVGAIVGTCIGVSSSRKARGNCKFELSSEGSYYIVTGKAGMFTRKMIIPDEYEGKPVQEIGEDLIKAYATRVSLKHLTIGNNVVTIGEDAFSSSGLKSVVIGDSVMEIGDRAFMMCYSLKEVYYVGTSWGWQDINIGANNKYLEEADVYYYSETKPAESGAYWHYDEDGEAVKW